MAFTVIFWLAKAVNHRGKVQVYEGVEYSRTLGGHVVLGALLFAGAQLLIQLDLYGIYKLRRHFCEKSCK